MLGMFIRKSGFNEALPIPIYITFYNYLKLERKLYLYFGGN